MLSGAALGAIGDLGGDHLGRGERFACRIAMIEHPFIVALLLPLPDGGKPAVLAVRCQAPLVIISEPSQLDQT
jgi:hypothetical protein